MTSSPQYNINALSGYTPMNWDSIMYNPYFLMAANSPNVNFKGSTEASANVTNSGNSQSVNQVAAQAEEPSEGVSLTQGVMALALIGAGAYGIIKGHKSGYFEKMWKKVTGKSNDKTVNTVLQQMTAVKNGNGEIKLMVPNKTKTFAGTHIEQGAEGYGIRGAIADSRKAFNPIANESAARGFQVNTPVGQYTVFMKDGKITKIIEPQEDIYNILKQAKSGTAEADLLKSIEAQLKTIASGKDHFQYHTPSGNYAVTVKNGKIDKILTEHRDVTSQLTNAEAKTTDAELLEKFEKIAEELGKAPKDADKSLFNDVVNISYVNKNGDDALKLTMSKYGAAPELKTFKTLEQFEKDAEAVKSYTPSASEEVFAGSLVNEKGSWINKKGVLVDGVGVLKCNEEIVRGTRCYFEGDKLVKIVQGENTYTEGSFGFKDFVKENKKAIEQFKKDVFVDKIASKIPTGSIIGLV